MARPLLGPEYVVDCGDVQGIVLRGYGELPVARFVMLDLGDAREAKSWLGDVATRVTSAREEPAERCTNFGISYRGLKKLGLDASVRAAFEPAFAEGMHGGPELDDGASPASGSREPSRRSRALHDLDDQSPDRWAWGGPSAPVDAILLLYARSDDAMRECLDRERGSFSARGIRAVTILEGVTLSGRKEHFGFRDGISQPALRNANPPTERPGVLEADRDENTAEPGEFLLGYPDAYAQIEDGPLVPESADPSRILPLAIDDAAGARSLGRNGSYLAFRQLEQDVAAFWTTIDRAANGDAAERLRLAARMVGRWPSGAPLALRDKEDDPSFLDRNDFGFAAEDALGLHCPIGSHIRRSNPRDFGGSGDPARALVVSSRHRLIRRGRPYGAPLDPDLDPAKILARSGSGESIDGARGLQFLSFQAHLERQFEFVMESWIHNAKFGGGHDETDPLLGDRGDGFARFTVPARPVRRRLGSLPRFVSVRGGAYFFVPGLRALRWLASGA